MMGCITNCFPVQMNTKMLPVDTDITITLSGLTADTEYILYAAASGGTSMETNTFKTLEAPQLPVANVRVNNIGSKTFTVEVQSDLIGAVYVMVALQSAPPPTDKTMLGNTYGYVLLRHCSLSPSEHALLLCIVASYCGIVPFHHLNKLLCIAGPWATI